ncbi:MAG: hypothetical protein WDW38_009851 [Sanguina aurantia]
MAVLLRRLVSTNKHRHVEPGYDLDLSYITPRIIAMGYPSSNLEALYRNPMPQVQRYFEHHGPPTRYRIYNLCIERSYAPDCFQGPVVQVPMYDGQAPPLHLMHSFCLDAAAWLSAHPSHIVVVHCKAGKGRTGALICALLLHIRSCTLRIWHRPMGSVETSLLLHASSGGSSSCHGGGGGVLECFAAEADSALQDPARDGSHHNSSLEVTQQQQQQQQQICAGSLAGPLPLHAVSGDFKVQLFQGSYRGDSTVFKSGKSLFGAWLNTDLLPEGDSITLGQHQLDKLSKQLRRTGLHGVGMRGPAEQVPSAADDRTRDRAASAVSGVPAVDKVSSVDGKDRLGICLRVWFRRQAQLP